MARPQEFTKAVNEFALSHEADAVGITPMDPLYVFEGYTIEEPTVIILTVGHNYERLKQVPSDETNGEGIADVGGPVCPWHAIIFRAGELDSLARIYGAGVSGADGRCIASHSPSRCLRPG